MEHVRVNGVELAYEREGSGPPLVLVHGSWTDHHGWDRVALRFARDFTVVRYDRRGHSDSERASGTTLDDVQDLASLIEALGLAPAHVACSSFGGIIGLGLAAASPLLLRSLVTHEPPVVALLPPEEDADAPAGGSGADVSAVVAQIEAGDHEGAARTFVDEVAFGPGSWDRFPRALRETFARNAHTFLEEERDPGSRGVDLEALRGFERPVLLTRGTESPSWFGGVVARLAEALPDASRHVYEGAGHGPQGTHPDDYVRVVGDFLREAEGR